MNLVGKIFAFLVLAMSLVFMAFAVAVYGTHKNWRDVVENPNTGLKAQIAKEQTRQQELKDEIDKLTAQISEEDVAKRKALADLETTRAQSDAKLKESQVQRDELQKSNQEAIAAMTAGQGNLDKMTKEVEVLRKEIRDAQTDRDKSFEQVVKLTDQVHQVTNEITRLKEREGQLAQQLASARMILSKRGISIGETDVPPPLRGKVLAVSQNDLLEVSLGADDGIRTGNTLEVFRGSSYLGRVQVLTTQSDRAVAKILPDFKKGVIQKGDDVATRFRVG
jgi:uncharacterized protein YlxW (UPF0749 family)